VSVYAGGFCQACSIFGIIGSLAFVPAAVTIVVMFSHTIMLMFFMAYRGDLKLTGFMSASTVSALFGLSLVVDVWTHAENIHPFGVFLAFVAALATAMRLYLFGKEVLLQHPIVVGAQIFSVAAICTLFLSLYQSPVMPHSFAGYGWIGACSLALILGTFGMFYGIALIGSFQWSLMAKLEPVFTAIFAFGVLGEILTVYQYLGIALVIGSLFLYQWVTAERRRKS
jgi:drug/metabolite transporter (DMT)-like permease